MTLMKISKKIKIGIIGLGYVGLPLFISFSKKFKTKGFDIDKEKISDLRNSKDKTLQIKKNELLNLKKKYYSQYK